MLVDIAADAFNETKSSIVEEAVAFRLRYLLEQVGKEFDLEDLRDMRETKKAMNKQKKKEKKLKK